MDRQPRILVVDDDAALVANLKDVLEANGYVVDGAASGKEALALCRQNSFDFALVDIKLPDMDGMELVRRIGDIPTQTGCLVVIVTGYASLESAIPAVSEKQVAGYETKPVDMDHLLTLIRQIARLKLAEDALREATSRYKMMFENMRDGVVVCEAVGDGADFVFRDFNRGAEEIDKISRGDVIGKSVTRCFPGVRDFGLFDVFQRVWKTGEPELHPASLYRDERISGWRENYVYKLPSGEIVSIYSDLTEQKMIEAQFIQDQKLKSIGHLAAGLAHEINTPTQFIGDNMQFLRDVFGDLCELIARYSEIVQRCAAGEELPAEMIAELDAFWEEKDMSFLLTEVPAALEQSSEGVARVSKIVHAMKQFADPDTKEKAPADLNRAIESTVTVARNEWKYVADVKLDLDPELPLVPCLLGELNQVFLSMVINAADAIGDVIGKNGDQKGSITVSTRRVGQWVEIRIKDTGAGIPEAIRPHIFDPFFTTKEVGRGTGQALSIAQTVVVLKHKGTILVETDVGKGTTFVIRLPLDDS